MKEQTNVLTIPFIVNVFYVKHKSYKKVNINHTAVDEQDDIRSELVLSVTVGLFGNNVKGIVIKTGAVDVFDTGAGGDFLVKSLPQVFIFEVEQ